MQEKKITKCFLAVLLALCCSGRALAGEKAAAEGKAATAEKSVAQEILDILRANNQIDAQQYETLLSKAKAEEAKRQGGEKKTSNVLTARWNDGPVFEGGGRRQVQNAAQWLTANGLGHGQWESQTDATAEGIDGDADSSGPTLSIRDSV